MKPLLALGAIAFLGLTYAAQAADLTPSESIKTSYGPSGFYVGGGIGRASYDREVDIDDISYSLNCQNCLPNGSFLSVRVPGQSDLQESDRVLHILAGYLFKPGLLGIGIEGDLTFGDDTPWGGPGCTIPVTPGLCSEPDFLNSIDNQAHIRAIAGVELGPFFPFLAAGVAIAKIGSTLAVVAESDVRDSFTLSTKDSETVVGLSIGTGVQVQVADHLSVRGEVLWDRYDETSFDGSVSGTDTSFGSLTLSTTAHMESQVDVTTGRLSVIWNFGRP
jgi:opacity protein-like surface antigen